MANGVSVASLGDGQYRITWPQPVRFDLKTLLLACTHHLRVLSQEEDEDQVIGVEGERELLLNWLRSLQVIDEENMKLYDEAMTESLLSKPGRRRNKTSQRPFGKSRHRGHGE